MTANTARDVLIAEMLGDIGKLHDLVASLKAELPAMLSQVDSMLNANRAASMAPQRAAQQFLDRYFRHELKGIYDNSNKAKDTALEALQREILSVVRKELSGARLRAEQVVDSAASRFEMAIDESAKIAEERASQALSEICQKLSTRVNDLQLERERDKRLAMIGACVATGLLVGTLSVFVLRWSISWT
jgi:hypothetical protein